MFCSNKPHSFTILTILNFYNIVWALTKSHLLLGTNLSNLSPALLAVVKNPQILAINQDTQFGQGIAPFRWTAAPPPVYQWEAPLNTVFQNDPVNPAAVGSFFLIPLRSHSSSFTFSFRVLKDLY